MFRTLNAKMIEKNISESDIAKAIGRTTRSVRAKIAGHTAFTWPEVWIIQREFFPEVSNSYLFRDDRDRE